MTPRAAIIANPTRIDLDEVRRVLPIVERRHGWEPTLVLETTVEDAGAGQTREALERGAELVIAAGGDGTVRLVAEQLVEAEADVPFAVVPAGTGNLLARNLGIAEYGARDALSIAFGGRDRRIDLARADVEREDGGRDSFVFAVIAGFGIDAGMIEHTDDTLKERIGWPAYIGGIAKWLLAGDAFRGRYRVGSGRSWGTRAATLMVGNCGLLQGGMRLLPEARIDDGRLDMIIMRPHGPIGWSMVGAGIVARGIAKQFRVSRLRSRDAVEGRRRILNYYQDAEFTFRLDTGPQAFEVDGDTAGAITAAHFSAIPEALTVRVA
ncbi:diacylglycerol kinase family protein [Gulosibacter sp. 10]|uniref:diacylglycerol/lipid kinase family protein n=1 Tax=Gulosibacter sp. 10 TaxID=1255570 RepID=UPI00097EF884|nr:diacylglycerol kinase family protein [Gulosibacter sp. 10]SJM55239.1 Conserved protein with diacylglycerol kinase catalytic domain [Gulosibacter sp. 10]